MTDNKRPWSPPQMIFSALGATIAWTAPGFSWFGPGFDWTTNAGAERMSHAAVTERLASICAAQARAMPEPDAAIKQMVDQAGWKRRQFVEEQHWANMPGSEAPDAGVAERCAEKLLPT